MAKIGEYRLRIYDLLYEKPICEYVENRGAAFGILKDSRWIFMAGSILIFCILIWLYYKTPLTKKYQPVRILTTFLGAGAVGNMIDRVFRGYVIDFFYFSLLLMIV